MLTPKRARYLLGGIRLVNGLGGLLAPRRLLKMMGLDPEKNGAAVYVYRLFGVRTNILGLQLLTSEGESLEEAVKFALPIHASDAAAASMAGLRGDLPARAAIIVTAISSFNTFLAVLARRSAVPRAPEMEG